MPRLIAQQPKEAFSYLQANRRRFIEEFARIRERYQLSSMVLVLDLASAKVISGLFTITQLVGQGIVFVERLEVVRKRLEHHAVYFITPTEQSIDAMLADFKDEDEPKYRKAHVLLSSSLQKELIRKIAKHQGFLKKLARHSFKEFYFEVSVLSENCVQLSVDYLALAFSQESFAEEEARSTIGRRFIDLVSAFDTLNVVRIYYEASASKVSERIAERAAKELGSYLERLLESKSTAIRGDAPDVTIYVTDRSLDIISPLIHGYAYESLLYDLMEVAEEAIDPSKLKGDIFDEFRYRHISHALSELNPRLNALVAKLSSSQLDSLEINKLKQEKQQLQTHVVVLDRLWQKFRAKNLGEIGELELCLATGVTQQSKQTVSSQQFQKIITTIKNCIQLTPPQLLRLALLTMICIKLCKEDYNTLVSLFAKQQRIFLENLAVFGVRLDKKITKSTKADKTIVDRAKKKLSNQQLASQRFSCALQMVLPRLLQYLKRDRTKKTQKNFMEEIVVSAISGSVVSSRFDEMRFICFMGGGLSQTEICSIRKNKELFNVILATDSILTPSKFVQALGKINLISKFVSQKSVASVNPK